MKDFENSSTHITFYEYLTEIIPQNFNSHSTGYITVTLAHNNNNT